jgi:hypothetical protein
MTPSLIKGMKTQQQNVDMMHWKAFNTTSVEFLQKICNLKLIVRKISDKLKLKDIDEMS